MRDSSRLHHTVTARQATELVLSEVEGLGMIKERKSASLGDRMDSARRPIGSTRSNKIPM